MQQRSSQRIRRCAVPSLGLALALVCGALPEASAQAYPSKPVRIVVPFAPGGTTDILARLVGQRLTDVLKQSVVIDNRPGANGALGTELVAKSPPDGHTILMGYLGSLAINPNLYAKLPYDSVRDFAPITLVASTTQALVLHPSLPVRTTRDLINLAKRQPGQISYASAGIGAPSHLAGELFKMMAAIDLVHVPYKGSGAATNDLLGGHVAMSFGGLAAAMPHVKTQRLRVLAVAGSARSAAMPDVPTISESGLPGYDVSSWFGLLAPAGTARDVVGRLHSEVVQILNADDVKKRLAADGAEVVANRPDEFAAYIKTEMKKWGGVIKRAQIKPQ
ncbi:MAG: tripartite tricarboxylate transporter substrate binding protein [Burkholderiales bacterium]|nr:tripartite tricarboxylate transporter substrate binding protein [Burkholderiales bacterium]